MQSLDTKRYQTYRNYQHLHEFTKADGELGATLEDKVKAREAEALTKRALDI